LHENRSHACYLFGSYRFDSTELMLSRGDDEISLSPTLARILLALVEKAGRTVTKEELLGRIWQDRFVEEGNLARNISFLRKALGDTPRAPRYIETIPRRGYRFVAPLKVVKPSANSISGTKLAVARVGLTERISRRGWLAGASSAALGAVWALSGGWGESAGYAARIESLVVLPFENLSGDQDGEIFAAGMTSAVTSGLGQINALKIISWRTAKRYEETEKTLPEIARELSVKGVVEGSVMRSGNRVRVTVQLVDAESDSQLWTESFERDLVDVILLQNRIARTVADRIEIAVTPAEQRRLTAAAAPVDPKAHAAYLKGLFVKSQGKKETTRVAIQFFEEALEVDPTFAPAYAAIGDCYLAMGSWDGLQVELWPRAREYAAKALEIDDTNAEAHVVRAGVMLCHDFNRTAAEREFAGAVRLNPGSSTALRRYAYCLASLGLWEEGVPLSERAIELDPASMYNQTMLGRVLYYGKQYTEAEKRLAEAIHLDDSFLLARQFMGRTQLQAHSSSKAVAEFERALSLGGAHETLGDLGFTYAISGRRDEALGCASALQRLSSIDGVRIAYNLALIRHGLGDDDQALDLLDKAYEERDYRLAFARVEPMWDGLRQTPRFERFLNRIGLQQEVQLSSSQGDQS